MYAIQKYEILKSILNILFRKKTITYILFIITAAIIRESLALGFDEDFERLFVFLNEEYKSYNVEFYILVLQIVLTKGSYITLSILFVLLIIFSLLKYQELVIPKTNDEDLKRLQEKINKIISEEKFPEIYNQLFHKLSSKFSPEYSEFYLRNLDIRVAITSLEDNQVEFIQSTRVTILPDKTQKYFKFKHPIIDQSRINYSTKLISYKVDGVDLMNKLENDLLKFETILEFKREIEVEYKHKFKYSILENPYHLFKMNTYCSNLHFEIFMPDNIEVGLFDLGNNNIYINNDSPFGTSHLQFKVENGVMPYDGFGIIFRNH